MVPADKMNSRNVKYNISMSMKEAFERLKKDVGGEKFSREIVDAINKRWQYGNMLKGDERVKNKIGDFFVKEYDAKEMGKEFGRRYVEERRKEVLRIFENFRDDMMSPTIKNSSILQKECSDRYFERLRKIMEGIE